MAMCRFCKKEMTSKVSCEKGTYSSKEGGGSMDAIKYGDGQRMPIGRNCPDCSTPIGGYHHEDCDQEECPHCHGQFLMCSFVDIVMH